MLVSILFRKVTNLDRLQVSSVLIETFYDKTSTATQVIKFLQYGIDFHCHRIGEINEGIDSVCPFFLMYTTYCRKTKCKRNFEIFKRIFVYITFRLNLIHVELCQTPFTYFGDLE